MLVSPEDRFISQHCSGTNTAANMETGRPCLDVGGIAVMDNLSAITTRRGDFGRLLPTLRILTQLNCVSTRLKLF